MNTNLIIAVLGRVLGVMLLLDWYTHPIEKPKLDAEFWVAMAVLLLSLSIWISH